MVLPPFVEGDLAVLVHVGANDYLGASPPSGDRASAESAAAFLRQNVASMISLLRVRYEKPNRAVVVLLGNIIDPTDGSGIVADGEPSGPCRRIAELQCTIGPKALLAQLQRANEAIAQEASVRGALLVDAHAAFLGHGLREVSDRWLDADGQKVLDVGHQVLREIAWKALVDGI